MLTINVADTKLADAHLISITYRSILGKFDRQSKKKIPNNDSINFYRILHHI